MVERYCRAARETESGNRFFGSAGDPPRLAACLGPVQSKLAKARFEAIHAGVTITSLRAGSAARKTSPPAARVASSYHEGATDGNNSVGSLWGAAGIRSPARA